jgi:hypothetical protein
VGEREGLVVKYYIESYVQTPTLPATLLCLLTLQNLSQQKRKTELLGLPISFTDFMSDEEETKASGEKEKRIKRTQSLEASVTLGLGYGQKKTQNEAFFRAVWPVLEGAGWTLVSEFVRVWLGSQVFGF